MTYVAENLWVVQSFLKFIEGKTMSTKILIANRGDQPQAQQRS